MASKGNRIPTPAGQRPRTGLKPAALVLLVPLLAALLVVPVQASHLSKQPHVYTLKRLDAAIPPDATGSIASDGHDVWFFGTLADGLPQGIARFYPNNQTYERLRVTMPEPRTDFALAWTGQVFLLFGGQAYANGTWTPSDRVLRFDPLNDVWVRDDARLPGPRVGAAAVWDGRSVLLGGGAPDAADRSAILPILRFVPQNDTFTETTVSLPVGQGRPSAAWAEGTLFFEAGYSDGGRRIKLDPAQAPRMLDTLHDASIFSDGQDAFVVGAGSATPHCPTGMGCVDVGRYDITGNDVVDASPLPYPLVAPRTTWTGPNAYIFPDVAGPGERAVWCFGLTCPDPRGATQDEPCRPGSGAAQWPQAGGSSRRDGAPAARAFVPKDLWTLPLRSETTTPPVVDDCRLFVGDGSSLAAFEPATGRAMWRTAVCGYAAVQGELAVAGGTVYVACPDAVVALDASSGAPMWTTRVDHPTSPIVAQGLAIVADAVGTVHALDAGTGASRWTYVTGTAVPAPPVAAGTTVVVPAGPGRWLGILLASGTLAWSVDGPATPYGLGLNDAELFGINADGLLFTGTFGQAPSAVGGLSVRLSGAPAADGDLLAASAGNQLVAIRAGTVAWTTAFSSEPLRSVRVGGTTVTATRNGTLQAAAPDGRVLWSAALAPMRVPPAVVGGVVFVVAGGTLVTVDATTGEHHARSSAPPATSPPLPDLKFPHITAPAPSDAAPVATSTVPDRAPPTSPTATQKIRPAASVPVVFLLLALAIVAVGRRTRK